ncbi:MAG: AbrB/MazE/SpoVT family DNA-binding domain-containing protein [Planctomycetes bacterium]|nr:AbrB/MazE/SpoVT family DNA-binding domain-containing protein [Planctomycetota bacterium]
MRVNVVRIGNSRGIRLPKAILNQCEISDALDLRVDGRRIVLVPLKSAPRAGWASAARRMSAAGDDALLLPDSLSEDADLNW